MASALVGVPTTLEAVFLGPDEETAVSVGSPITVEIVWEQNPASVVTLNATEDPESPGRYTVVVTLAQSGLHSAVWSGVTPSGIRSQTTYFTARTRRLVSVADVRAAEDSALGNSERYTSAALITIIDQVQDEFETILGFPLTASAPPIVYGYGSGVKELPGDLRWAVLKRIVSIIVGSSSSVPDRATTYTAAEGGTYALATAGRAGLETGIPDVDAILKRHAIFRPGVA